MVRIGIFGLVISLILCGFAHAQTFPTAPLNGPGPPTNPCSNGVLYTDNTNGNLWSCKSGAWVLPSSGGGGGGGITPPAGDIGGTTSSPTVTSTHLTAPLPVVQGGTGTTTPSLVQGANIVISGLWPNQTVSAVGGGTGDTSNAVNSTALQYVAQNCAGNVPCVDTNDGLSWATAKAHPYNALLALPNGSTSPPTAGNGKVLVSSDPINGVPFGGPAGANAGWWMFGTTDPNYTAGLTGWMRAPAVGSVMMECAAPTSGIVNLWGNYCQEFWGGRTDTTHPALWFSSLAGKVNVRGFGFNYESNPIKIGIDSTGNRTGTSNGTSSVWLDQLNVNVGDCYTGQGAGPALDIGGASFWIKLSDSSYSGCVSQAYRISAISRSANLVTVTLDHSGTGDIVADGSAKILIRNVADPSFNGAWVIASISGTTVTYAQNGPATTSSGGQAFTYGAAAIGIYTGSGPGAGFVYVQNVVTNRGGIWAQGGYNGVGLNVDHLVYEGDQGAHADMSTVEFLSPTPYGDTSVYVNDVEPADNGNPICGVESFTGGNISVFNSSVCGPMTMIGGITGTVSPLRQGMTGFYNGRGLVASVDAGRRMFSPVAVRWANLVSTDSSGWTVTGTGLTITGGQSAPDGSTGAYLISNPTGSTTSFNFGGVFSGAQPQLGSIYFFGVYERSATPGVVAPGIFFNLNSAGIGAGNYCQGGTTSAGANIQSARIIGDGEWEWHAGLCKIITNPSGGYERFDVNLAGGNAVAVFAPVFGVIPAGAVSDNEAWEFVNNLQSYPAGVSAGTVAMLPTQTLEATNANIIGSLSVPSVAGLTTTAAASDNVTVTGVTASSHCQLTPTNASAATNIATTYISAKTTNQITVTHTATSGMTYDVFCTAN